MNKKYDVHGFGRRSRGWQWRPFVLVASIGMVATGCSKKAEQCATFAGQTSELSDKITVDVTTDNEPKSKVSALQSLLDSVRKAQEANGQFGAIDGDLTEKAAAYTKALHETEASATDLKQFFESVDATSVPLATLATAKQGVDDAMQAQLNELSLNEKKKLGAALAPFGDTADDLEKTASVIESMKYGTDDATKKSAALAAALRKKAAARRTTDGLQETLDGLAKQSDGKRSAFVSARKSLKNAMGALDQACAPAK